MVYVKMVNEAFFKIKVFLANLNTYSLHKWLFVLLRTAFGTAHVEYTYLLTESSNRKRSERTVGLDHFSPLSHDALHFSFFSHLIISVYFVFYYLVVSNFFKEDEIYSLYIHI